MDAAEHIKVRQLPMSVTVTESVDIAFLLRPCVAAPACHSSFLCVSLCCMCVAAADC